MKLRSPALAWAILLLSASGCGDRLEPGSVRSLTGIIEPNAESGRAGPNGLKKDLAPTIQITSPQPSALLAAIVKPTVNISWNASDPDGPRGVPSEIRYTLLNQNADLTQFIIAHPDTLIGLYGPTFSAWNLAPDRSAGVTLTGLVPGNQYLFIVTALDRHGLFDPVFTLNKNMLRMIVVPAGPLDAGGAGTGFQ